MLEEVLLPIGTVCIVSVYGINELSFMIVGRRIYNPHDGRAYDYASVPFHEGLDIDGRADSPFKTNNLFFFNHTQIIKILEEKENGSQNLQEDS